MTEKKNIEEYEYIEFPLEISNSEKFTFSINFNKIFPNPQINWIKEKLKKKPIDIQLYPIKKIINLKKKEILKVKIKILCYKLLIRFLKFHKTYCDFWRGINWQTIRFKKI